MELTNSNSILKLINKSNYDSPKNLPDGVSFRIAAVDDSYHSTGKVFVKVLVEGTGKIFDKSVHEIFSNRDWLKKFSKDDAARIGFLHAAEVEKNPALIDAVIKQEFWPKTNSILIIGIIYTTFLILSNISALKVSMIFGYQIPSGLIFFPLTYIFDDILTEVYGFKLSRRIIWIGLVANLIITLGIFIVTFLPPSPLWHQQKEFESVFSLSPRIFLASVLSYLVGEFINSTILAKLKILTTGKYLWIRLLGSTASGVVIESLLFALIAFYGVFPAIVLREMMLVQICVKVGYEMLAFPLTYKIVKFLKRVDDIDYYDINTRFNPFSLKLDN